MLRNPEKLHKADHMFMIFVFYYSVLYKLMKALNIIIFYGSGVCRRFHFKCTCRPDLQGTNMKFQIKSFYPHSVCAIHSAYIVHI